MININGIQIEGNNLNVTMKNGAITINGKHIDALDNLKGYEVTIEGDVHTLNVSGSVTVNGNVTGNIDAGGSVSCKDVSGDIDAGGSIKSGKCNGNIDAGGSVSIHK